MISKANTVIEYLDELPDDRRVAIQTVRQVILKNLRNGFEEGMQYGMIGYFVPHSLYPAGYHCDPQQPVPFAALASQKNHMAVYLMCLYTDSKEEQEFRQRWAATGKKLDMGKSCVRFQKLDDLPLEIVGDAIARVTVNDHIAIYEAAIRRSRENRKSAPKKKAADE